MNMHCQDEFCTSVHQPGEKILPKTWETLCARGMGCRFENCIYTHRPTMGKSGTICPMNMVCRNKICTKVHQPGRKILPKTWETFCIRRMQCRFTNCMHTHRLDIAYYACVMLITEHTTVVRDVVCIVVSYLEEEEINTNFLPYYIDK